MVKFSNIVIILSIIITLFTNGCYSKPPESQLKGISGDDWVYTDSDVFETQYYNPNSINIDKPNKIINVLIKIVYTNMGKNRLLRLLQTSKAQKVKVNKYLDLKYSIILYSIDYKNWKYGFTELTFYSNAGVLDKENSKIEWMDIKPNTMMELLVYKILKDNNIQR